MKWAAPRNILKTLNIIINYAMVKDDEILEDTYLLAQSNP